MEKSFARFIQMYFLLVYNPDLKAYDEYLKKIYLG